MNTGDTVYCFSMLLNVVWWDGGIIMDGLRIIAHGVEWAGKGAWILIIGFFRFRECCCHPTVFKVLRRVCFIVLERVERHVRGKHDWC